MEIHFTRFTGSNPRTSPKLVWLLGLLLKSNPFLQMFFDGALLFLRYPYLSRILEIAVYHTRQFLITSGSVHQPMCIGSIHNMNYTNVLPV